MMILKKWQSYVFIFCCTCSFLSCRQAKEQSNYTAENIIDSAVEAHGGTAYNNMDISFVFRGATIRLQNDGGNFLYQKTFSDSSTAKTFTDELTNSGFKRMQDSTQVALPDSTAAKLTYSLNSIAYFALLPFKLKEPAVQAEFIADTSILGVAYQKIRVSFNKEGGGKDFTDQYCYWFNAKTHHLDYLAYTNGGPRFRVATTQHKIDGIYFQDYDNYAFKDTTVDVIHYDAVFLAGKMNLLSEITTSDYKSLK